MFRNSIPMLKYLSKILQNSKRRRGRPARPGREADLAWAGSKLWFLLHTTSEMLSQIHGLRCQI